jgi:hypothetical protein
MLLRSGLAALLLALTFLLGVLAPASQAAQTTYPGLNRIFALGNENLDIDGVDDQRVDVNVAVMDIGIDLDDPDLNIGDGLDCNGATPTDYTCESDSPDDGDVDGPPFYGWDHGTYTAKAIGAIDNSIGTVGVAPGARIWSLAVAPLDTYEYHRIQTNTSTVNLSAMIAALQWVIGTRTDSDPSNDIHVLTAWVGPECPPNPATRPRIICPGGITGAQSLLIESLVTEATNEGVAIVRASGNWGEDMGPFHLYDPNGDKNYIISSSVVDTDGLPGGLGPDGARCGGIHDDGPTNVPDDHSNPGTGWGVGVDVAAPGSCSSSSKPWMAGAAAVLASQIKPDSRADVDDIRDALVDTGNFDWTDDSTDGVKEPLVDVSDEGVFDPDALEVQPAHHVFYRGANGQLNQYTVDGSSGATTHTQLGYGGHMVGDPAAVVARNSTRRFVYYQDATGQLHQYWEEGSGWNHSVHGPASHMGGSPAAVIGHDGARHVFYRGANGQLNHYTFSHSGETRTQLGNGGHMVGDPTAVVGHDGTLFVFYQDATGQLHGYWERGTSWNHSVHGPVDHIGGNPAALVGSDGSRHVFYRGANGQLNQFTFTSSGETRTQLGYDGHMVGDPTSVVSLNGERRFAFYKDVTGQLHQYSELGPHWNHTVHGSLSHVGSAPTATVDPFNKRWVFYANQGGSLDRFWELGPNSSMTTYGANNIASDPAVITTLRWEPAGP